MTQLNELINKHIDSIKFNGCQLSKEMLTLMFDGVVALAKLQESFEINQRYLESIGTAFGNGGNDLTKAIGETPKHLQYPFFVGGGGGDMSTAKTDGGTGGSIQVNTIGQHITEPEFIQPNEMVKGKWYKAYLLVTNSYWVFKFVDIHNNKVHSKESVNIESGNAYKGYGGLTLLENISQIRPATIEEVTKFFPNEFDSNVTEHPNKY
jgi:hypothetical protein